jgi:alkylation response protein AidB-like acyl-CoA dehydrogenase
MSTEEAAFRDVVRGFADREVRPRRDEMELAGRLDPALVESLFAIGLMGIQVPTELGGAGANLMMTVLAVEELAAVDPSVAVMVDVQNTLVDEILLRWAEPELRRRYLPRLASEMVGAFALSEAEAGSDAFALTTRAERRGHRWRLRGRKQWISNGAEAGLFVVFANADPARGRKGITAFAVERDVAGLDVGKPESKLGIRASSTTELVLDDCEVPAGNLIGEVGQGYRIAMEALNLGRIGIGAQMVGLARGALDEALSYVEQRRQFGRRVAEFQGVQFQLARAATELAAARLLVVDAARRAEAGLPHVKQAAMAKLYAAEVAQRVSSLAVDLHGGNGYSKGHPAERFYRDAKVGSIYEGTSNMQLVTIARELGLPASNRPAEAR